MLPLTLLHLPSNNLAFPSSVIILLAWLQTWAQLCGQTSCWHLLRCSSDYGWCLQLRQEWLGTWGRAYRIRLKGMLLISQLQMRISSGVRYDLQSVTTLQPLLQYNTKEFYYNCMSPWIRRLLKCSDLLCWYWWRWHVCCLFTSIVSCLSLSWIQPHQRKDNKVTLQLTTYCTPAVAPSWHRLPSLAC